MTSESSLKLVTNTSRSVGGLRRKRTGAFFRGHTLPVTSLHRAVLVLGKRPRTRSTLRHAYWRGIPPAPKSPSTRHRVRASRARSCQTLGMSRFNGFWHGRGHLTRAGVGTLLLATVAWYARRESEPAWFRAPWNWRVIEYQSNALSNSHNDRNQIYSDEAIFGAPLPPAQALTVVKRILNQEIQGEFTVPSSTWEYESSRNWFEQALHQRHDVSTSAQFASECGTADSRGFGRPDSGTTTTSISVKITASGTGSRVIMFEGDSNAAVGPGPMICS